MRASVEERRREQARSNSSRRWKRPSNRTLIVCGAILVVLVVFIAAGIMNWQQRANTSKQAVVTTKRLAETIVNEKTSMTERRSAINELAASVQADPCAASWWDGWAASVPPSNQSAERCRLARSKVRTVQAAAKGLSDYLANESDIIAIIVTLKVDPAKKNWQETAAKAANQAVKGIDALRVGSDAKTLQAAALKRTKAISNGWKALKSADTKKDRTAYDASRQQLEQSYADLAQLSDVSDARITDLATKLHHASTQL